MREKRTELIEITEEHLTNIDLVADALKSIMAKAGVVGDTRVVIGRLGIGKSLQVYMEEIE